MTAQGEARGGGVRAALDAARDFIDLMPHGDKCFLDPNRPDIHRCWCGKDSMLEVIDDALGAESEHASPPVEAVEAARELLSITQGDLRGIGRLYERLPDIQRVARALLSSSGEKP